MCNVAAVAIAAAVALVSSMPVRAVAIESTSVQSAEPVLRGTVDVLLHSALERFAREASAVKPLPDFEPVPAQFVVRSDNDGRREDIRRAISACATQLEQLVAERDQLVAMTTVRDDTEALHQTFRALLQNAESDRRRTDSFRSPYTLDSNWSVADSQFTHMVKIFAAFDIVKAKRRTDDAREAWISSLNPIKLQLEPRSTGTLTERLGQKLGALESTRNPAAIRALDQELSLYDKDLDAAIGRIKPALGRQHAALLARLDLAQPSLKAETLLLSATVDEARRKATSLTKSHDELRAQIAAGETRLTEQRAEDARNRATHERLDRDADILDESEQAADVGAAKLEQLYDSFDSKPASSVDSLFARERDLLNRSAGLRNFRQRLAEDRRRLIAAIAQLFESDRNLATQRAELLRVQASRLRTSASQNAMLVQLHVEEAHLVEMMLENQSDEKVAMAIRAFPN